MRPVLIFVNCKILLGSRFALRPVSRWRQQVKLWYSLLSVYCLTTSTSVAQLFAFPTLKLGSKTGLVHKVKVIGKDERRVFNSGLLDSVGTVYNRQKKGSCTAFCVAPNIIASNAHCLIRYPERSKDVDLSTVIFALRRPAGSGVPWKTTRLKYAEKSQPLLSVYAGYYRGARTAWKCKDDWEFAKIENPICDGKVLTFLDRSRSDVVKASRSAGPFVIGYHGDKSIKQPWLSP